MYPRLGNPATKFFTATLSCSVQPPAIGLGLRPCAWSAAAALRSVCDVAGDREPGLARMSSKVVAEPDPEREGWRMSSKVMGVELERSVRVAEPPRMPSKVMTGVFEELVAEGLESEGKAGLDEVRLRAFVDASLEGAGLSKMDKSTALHGSDEVVPVADESAWLVVGCWSHGDASVALLAA